jgi:5'-deoxynucleotidase YfbR-like HD superfamily hydrolase
MNDNFSPEEIDPIAQAAVQLGELAMHFGRIDRTCVAHPDGTPESDTDHTVMLAWVAPALADLLNVRYGFNKYPTGKVAQFAVVHDACEVYAGDTPTIRISAAELESKEEREKAATDQLNVQFRRSLPWFAQWVVAYERQWDPCARFVRSVDKIMPKIVHVINRAEDLFRAQMSLADFEALYIRQRNQIAEWCPEPLLLHVYDALCSQVITMYGSPVVAHVFVVESNREPHLEHNDCEYELLHNCPVQIAFDLFLNTNMETLKPGRYEVTADMIGQLIFNGR